MLFPLYARRFHKSLVWRFAAQSLDSLSIFSKKNNKFSDPKRIVVIRKDEIGDVMLSVPVYEALKKRFPKSKLSVIAGKLPSQVLKNNPYVDDIIEFNTSRSALKNLLGLVSALKKGKFDLSVDLKGSIVNIIAMYLAKIPRRLSYYNISGGKVLLTDPVEYTHQVSEVEANLDLAKYLGAKTNSLPKIYLTEKEKKSAEKFIREHLPKKYICLYSTPSKKYKEWPLERWKELCDSMPQEMFVFVGSQHDRFLLSGILGRIRNAFFLETDLRTLSVAFSNAKAIVAVDGGPMHLAWASNPRTIALFGQNDLVLWKPLRGKIITHYPQSKQGLNRDVPNLNRSNYYMSQISVQEVLTAIRGYIK